MIVTETPHDHIRVTYEYIPGIQVHTDDIRVHTGNIPVHTSNIRVHTSNIRVTYEYTRAKK